MAEGNPSAHKHPHSGLGAAAGGSDVLFAHPGAHCCVWSLGWGVPRECSTFLGSPAAANEGRALLLVPALLPVTTQKLFKWN